MAAAENRYLVSSRPALVAAALARVALEVLEVLVALAARFCTQP